MEGVANPKRRDLAFAVGDRVWLSSAHLPVKIGARKLAAKWAGPFAVEAQFGWEAYRLTLASAWRIHPVFHTSQLKPVVGQPREEAPVQLESGEQEFEVEKILGMRNVRSGRQFLVKWKGYGDWENSWEPEEN